jgi:hypothetical protein
VEGIREAMPRVANRRFYDPSGPAKPLVIIWRSILVAPLCRLRSPQEFDKLTRIPP